MNEYRKFIIVNSQFPLVIFYISFKLKLREAKEVFASHFMEEATSPVTGNATQVIIPPSPFKDNTGQTDEIYKSGTCPVEI